MNLFLLANCIGNDIFIDRDICCGQLGLLFILFILIILSQFGFGRFILNISGFRGHWHGLSMHGGRCILGNGWPTAVVIILLWLLCLCVFFRSQFLFFLQFLLFGFGQWRWFSCHWGGLWGYYGYWNRLWFNSLCCFCLILFILIVFVLFRFLLACRLSVGWLWFIYVGLFNWFRSIGLLIGFYIWIVL